MIVLVAATIGALFVMVALVVDLSGARRDRDADQVAADAIALAGASSLGGSDSSAVMACEAAWDYIVVNLPTARTAPAPSCTAFSTACVPTVARQVQTTISEYAITLVHPVPTTSSLLQGQTAGALDGSPCDRFGVRVQQTRANLVASGSTALDVTATARYIRGVGDVQAPLVLLAEHACAALTVNGTANLTVTTPSGAPGYIVVDSDGAACSNPNKVVFDVDGNGTVAAGQISMWALADGDPTSAYSNGLVSPVPTPSSAPVGQNGMQWRYNCNPASGCPFAGPPHIDDMVASWGSSGEPSPLGTFTRWTTSGRSCSPSGATVVPTGDWYIDCGSSGISTNGTVTFQGGNIVSDGPITANGSGGLRVNCSDSDPTDLIAPATCPADPPAPSILYLRSGDLADSGDLDLRETMVYLASGKVTINGNHTINWTAPNDPAHRFDDLLVWTATTSLIKITGSVNLNMEGTFFAPNAALELAGSSGGQALGAQIFARTASLAGTAQLTLAPKADRSLPVGNGRPVLVR